MMFPAKTLITKRMASLSCITSETSASGFAPVLCLAEGFFFLTRVIVPCRTEKVDFREKKTTIKNRITKKTSRCWCVVFFLFFSCFFPWVWFSSLFFFCALVLFFFCQTLYSLCCWGHKPRDHEKSGEKMVEFSMKNGETPWCWPS